MSNSEAEHHRVRVRADRVPLTALPGLVMERWMAWLHTRDIRLLVQGLPAVFLGALIAYAVIYQRQAGQGQATERYRQAVKQAIENDDFQAADVFVRKLAWLAPKEHLTLYSLGVIAEHNGDLQRASRFMAELAPEDAVGYAPAHFWFVKKISGQGNSLPSRDAARLRHHLQATLADEPSHAEAAGMLGRLEYAAGKYDEAVKYLEVAANTQVRLGLLLARAHLEQGNRSRANLELERLSDRARTRLENNTGDQASRVLLAEALWLQEHFAESESVLRDGLTGSDDEQIRHALANLYVAQSDRLAETSDTQLAPRLELLQKALTYWPGYPHALLRLATFVHLDATESQQARSLLQAALADGKASTLAHLILGTTAATKQELQTATMHLEQAYRLNQNVPAILNNLAWVLANSNEPELERALELANSALHLSPGHPEIHETRGQILAKLGRWQDALVDLEIALERFPDRSRLHETLAAVDGALGDEEMAALHRKRAD